MGRKGYSILLVPRDNEARGVREMRLSGGALLGIALAAFIVIAGFAAMLTTYGSAVVDQVSFARLQRENVTLRHQLARMGESVGELRDQMDIVAQRDDNLRSYLFLDPLPEEFRRAGIGGSRRSFDTELYLLSNETAGAAKEAEVSLDQLSREVKLELESLLEIDDVMAENEAFLAGFPSIKPIDGEKYYTRLTSAFGMRYHPILQTRKFHEGNDWYAREGTPVRATADGVVIGFRDDVKGRTQSGLGNFVRIDHGNGYTTVYGHLSALHPGIRNTKRVKRGDIIGYVGGTGFADGVHLHYAVIYQGKYVNPWYFYHDDRVRDATGVTDK
jgi:murein DD-endopeptidase MepM/ murein hydrolase activator NlpD